MPPRLRIPIHRLRFRPLHGVGNHAQCWKDRRVIELDPRSRDVARNYLHELLHLAHQGWSETRVRREEGRLWRALGWRDKARLYQALGRGSAAK